MQVISAGLRRENRNRFEGGRVTSIQSQRDSGRGGKAKGQLKVLGRVETVGGNGFPILSFWDSKKSGEIRRKEIFCSLTFEKRSGQKEFITAVQIGDLKGMKKKKKKGLAERGTYFISLPRQIGEVKKRPFNETEINR